MRRVLTHTAGVALAMAIGVAKAAHAQDTGDAPPPEAVEVPGPPDTNESTPTPGEASPPSGSEAREVYTPQDFVRFAPRTARDMLDQVPGFTIQTQDAERGLGQASGNILINGQRFSSKSVSTREQLRRIPSDNVVRIEIVDGASLDIPGLTGRIANIVTEPGALSGQFQWRPQVTTGPAAVRWGQGEVSVSGARGPVNFTFALSNDQSYGGSDGGNLVTDALGQPDRRFSRSRSDTDTPQLSANFATVLPGNVVANANLSFKLRNGLQREWESRLDPLAVPLDERIRTKDDRYSYELGGDVAFSAGPGRLRLIVLESFEHVDYATQALLTAGDRPTTGTRFARLGKSGERIGRGEYNWQMFNADWQVSGEAAFNRLDNVASLFVFDSRRDDFRQIDFPAGTGGVREERYQASLSLSRPLGQDLSFQANIGGEYSSISQTGAGALSRTFLRPKGSLAIAWSPMGGLDINFEIARRVGQLDFGDFLAQVDLQDDVTNVGNNLLRPQQSWEVEMQLAKNLGPWGSATLTLFDQKISDYVTIVPIEGGGESSGNVDSASRHGLLLKATLRTDPAGLQGGQFDITLAAEDSRLKDPVGLFDRRFDKSEISKLQIDFRHDIPATDWAYGSEFRVSDFAPYYRIREFGFDYNYPTFGAVFIEHKDLAGLTVQARFANLFNSGSVLRRTVYTGPRGDSAVLFAENRNRAVGYTFNLNVSGNF